MSFHCHLTIGKTDLFAECSTIIFLTVFNSHRQTLKNKRLCLLRRVIFNHLINHGPIIPFLAIAVVLAVSGERGPFAGYGWAVLILCSYQVITVLERHPLFSSELKPFIRSDEQNV